MENPVVAGVLVALVVPFLGNTLGAALVLFARHGMSERFTKALLGFAAGVMIAASVWSLIVPALEAAEGGAVPSWLPVGAGFLAGDPTITLASVTTLSVGIAIQNVPEGAIVSLPLATNGLSRPRAFLAGTLCGAVEPLGAAIMVAITGLVTPLLPVVLAFAAGAMMYVVTEELIPQTQQGHHTNIGTIGVAFGFVLMMVLDVALG